MIITKTSQDLKPVLMEGVKAEVKEPYSMIIDTDQVVFVVNQGINGVEFNKTEGYFSNYPGVQVYQCLYGQGVLVMQRNDELGEAKEFKVVTLNSGRQVGVPAGWAICLVNVGKAFLVVVGNVNIRSKDIDSRPVLAKKGLAYYIVEKKGEVGFEQNPNYKIHPQITTE
ncbi:MAG: glucose-6-phosphate isomerase family protein [Candidatus Daviesbacteria bacterium]|nr:glucose-6-phosphate isomerase family protein [Candidatus Daviesbacteria bacterium]